MPSDLVQTRLATTVAAGGRLLDQLKDRWRVFPRLLGLKFGWKPDRVEAAVTQMTRIASVVEPAETLQVIAADPADDRVLEAAIALGAEVIVSGDQHLLDLGTWSDIEIMSPAEFIDRRSA